MYLSKNATFYMVRNFPAIEDKLIPFFSKHRIQGVKVRDLKDWCLEVELIKNKAHLTKEGLDNIRNIKASLNKGRSETF